MIAFGPVPSRRLGKSLGINNISSGKKCSYSCVYCQVGITRDFCLDRRVFYEPSIVFDEVSKHVEKLAVSDKPDFLTFVANGELTLDVNLGVSIGILKELGIPIAVITNASLLSDKKVREELQLADWVSVKVDAGNEVGWKQMNRPVVGLDFNRYVGGIRAFSEEYKGKLVTETMLVKGINDGIETLFETAALVGAVNPSVAYLSIPTRPPAETFVTTPDEKRINDAYQVFSENGIHTELILGFEGVDTGFTGNAVEDIINICSVHPIREDMMQELLMKDHADATTLDELIHNQYVQSVVYKSHTFYIRKFRN